MMQEENKKAGLQLALVSSGTTAGLTALMSRVSSVSRLTKLTLYGTSVFLFVHSVNDLRALENKKKQQH